ncbi:ATP phosphoribosyltransferase, catalytic domain-containing protein, partial [Tanacetum coccineum]
MGVADVIVDLVSSGTTLKENYLKEIEGGVLLKSQAVMVASKKSLVQRKGLLDITQEILESFEAHLRALDQLKVEANMRANSAEEVAERILSQSSLSGLQGPTISLVFRKVDGVVTPDYYAIVICVPEKELYKSVQQLRAIGGSGILVSPLTFTFKEETPRWRELLSKLGF